MKANWRALAWGAIGCVGFGMMALRGCTGQPQERGNAPSTQERGHVPKSQRLTTVEHDGHWWVAWRGAGEHFAHHLDCPCRSNRLKQEIDLQRKPLLTDPGAR